MISNADVERGLAAIRSVKRPTRTLGAGSWWARGALNNRWAFGIPEDNCIEQYLDGWVVR